MKKVFAFVVAASLCAGTYAENWKLNNPTDENGRYIVLWDCEAEDFAASNAFTPGQTVTIAFDLEGTDWAELLKGAAPEGTTLIPAAHMWFDFEKNGEKVASAVDRNPATERLKKITGDIYGATINLAQNVEANSAGKGALAVAQGTIVYTYCMLHIANFKNADGTPGDVWWQNALQVDYGAGDCLFATQPGDGNIDPAFTGADFAQKMFINDEPGYAAPCVMEEPSALEHVKAVKGLNKFIEGGHLYFKAANGQIVNALGATVLR